MTFNDGNWLSIVNAFSSAALGAESWVNALRMLGEATGSRCGELIGLGQANAVPFNYVSDMDEEWQQEFIAVDGGNPAVNPVVRAGTQCAAGTVLSSAEFLTSDERRTNAFIQEHAARYDFAHICLTPLVKTEEMLIGLAVLRSARQGEITAAQRHIFTSIAPHVLAAVKLQLVLESHNVLSATGALRSAHVTAFICDSSGKVLSTTEAGEDFIRNNSVLRIKNGILNCLTEASSKSLSGKIAAVTRASSKPLPPADSTLPLKDNQGRHIMIEISPMPRGTNSYAFEPKAIVIVRHPRRRSGHLESVLRIHYKLSSSETDVCLKLTDGLSIADISEIRHSSIETVRKQLKSIFEKLQIHSQSELVALVNQLS